MHAKRSHEALNTEHIGIFRETLHRKQCKLRELEAKSAQVSYHFQNKHPQHEIAQCLRCTKLCVYVLRMLYIKRERRVRIKAKMHEMTPDTCFYLMSVHISAMPASVAKLVLECYMLSEHAAVTLAKALCVLIVVEKRGKTFFSKHFANFFIYIVGCIPGGAKKSSRV